MRASDCLALQQRLAQEHPESDALIRPGCFYSDRTYARTGQLAPARCLGVGVRTCGLGCDACPGDASHPGVCLFVSEASPTGVCARVADSGYLDRPCSRLAKSNPCGFGEACVLPLRNNADRIADTARDGICIERASCQAIAAQVPESYFCDTFGL
ncbi:MAG: hypothetical protein Q7V43_35025 [Myxococcales bacterium]|nr:hypothetical protein [Myxococcales bacterium]